MKRLLLKEFLLGDDKCIIELFINKDDFIEYEFSISLSKNFDFNNDSSFNYLLKCLMDVFSRLEENKYALYVPTNHNIDIYDDEYIYVCYSQSYMHPILDKGFKKVNNNIGKELFHIELFDENSSQHLLKIKFKSLFLINEYNQITSLWNTDNKIISDFFRKNIINFKQITNSYN